MKKMALALILLVAAAPAFGDVEVTLIITVPADHQDAMIDMLDELPFLTTNEVVIIGGETNLVPRRAEAKLAQFKRLSIRYVTDQWKRFLKDYYRRQNYVDVEDAVTGE